MPSTLRQRLPNAITILRLVLAAAFFVVLNQYQYPGTNPLAGNIAIGLFIVAAFTDFLDGYLARKWNAVSRFGRIMDPFCDKVLVLGAFVYLAGPRFAIHDASGAVVDMATGVTLWMVVAMLARELLVTGIRGVVEATGVSFAASWSGKAKMILQSIAIPLVLVLAINVRDGYDGPLIGHLCTGVMLVTVAVTVWSGIPYVQRLRQLKLGAADTDQ